MLSFQNLEQVFFLSKDITPAIEVLKSINLSKNKEIDVYIKTENDPDKEPFKQLESLPNAWEISEIPEDFQEEGEVLIFSLVWSLGWKWKYDVEKNKYSLRKYFFSS